MFSSDAWNAWNDNKFNIEPADESDSPIQVIYDVRPSKSSINEVCISKGDSSLKKIHSIHQGDGLGGLKGLDTSLCECYLSIYISVPHCIQRKLTLKTDVHSYLYALFRCYQGGRLL